MTAKQPPRFCDITGVGDWLYALDRNGRAWKWSPREHVWVPIGETRAPGTQDEQGQT